MLIYSFTVSQSEEDKQLQEDLEMMVERLGVSIWSIFFFKTTASVCWGIKAPTKLKTSLVSTHLQEKNTALYRPALEELRRLIRSSTTSMTSVPKPLKFLRPHYGKLKEIYDGMAAGENKVRFCCAARKWGN